MTSQFMLAIDDLSVYRSHSQSGYKGDFLTVYSHLTRGRCAEACRFAGSDHWHIRPFLIPSYMQGITTKLIREAEEKFIVAEQDKKPKGTSQPGM